MSALEGGEHARPAHAPVNRGTAGHDLLLRLEKSMFDAFVAPLS